MRYPYYDIRNVHILIWEKGHRQPEHPHGVLVYNEGEIVNRKFQGEFLRELERKGKIGSYCAEDSQYISWLESKLAGARKATGVAPAHRMKCQKGKECPKRPGNSLPILHGDKICTGCNHVGKDRISVGRQAARSRG